MSEKERERERGRERERQRERERERERERLDKITVAVQQCETWLVSPQTAEKQYK